MIELLVSMAVLALLLTLVAQMVNSTVTTTVNSGKHIDADGQARLIFDRMGADFASICRRADAPSYFHSQSGNDEAYFYSDAAGYFATADPNSATMSIPNSASLLGYRVSDRLSGGSRLELERLGRGLHWFDGGNTLPNGPATMMVFLPGSIPVAFKDAIADPYNNSSNLRSSTSDGNAPQWDVIGDQVFRMEFCFVLSDGSLSSIPVTQPTAKTNNLAATTPPGPGDDSGSGYSQDSRWYDKTAGVGYRCRSAGVGQATWAPLGMLDIKGFVVAVAIMDSKTRKICSATSLQSAVQELPDFDAAITDPNTGKPYLMANLWLKKVNAASTFATTTRLPPSAVSAIHIYQRWFSIN